jgi:hypothetical protein
VFNVLQGLDLGVASLEDAYCLLAKASLTLDPPTKITLDTTAGRRHCGVTGSSTAGLISKRLIRNNFINPVLNLAVLLRDLEINGDRQTAFTGA